MAGTLIRKDAWKMPKWDPILLWYAKGIGEMQRRSLAEPTSWRYQAAIHGYDRDGDPLRDDDNDILPSDNDQRDFWSQCQHGSWYFLPWHRMYLGLFEQMVRAEVVHLGGPADWTLPYWNYSDPQHTERRALPAAFLEPNLPDGQPNPLFIIAGTPGGTPVLRGTLASSGRQVAGDPEVSVTCLKQPYFDADPIGGSKGFGGGKTIAQHRGGSPGELEKTPHGDMHDAVDGWMSTFETAALDSIFWLHHANIDRLWTVWTNRDSKDVDPPDSDWLTKISFQFNQPGGGIVIMTPSQVMDSRTSPFAYDYEDTADPLAPPAQHPGHLESPMRRRPMDRPIPEMVGATEKPLTLTGGTHAAAFKIGSPSGPAVLGVEPGAAPRRTFLNLENVTGKGALTGYRVYVNLPEGADPEKHMDLCVGTLPMFGVAEASIVSKDHPGTGLSFSFDISETVAALSKHDAWNAEDVHVTLVAKNSAERKSHSPVQIGRISLYYA